MKYEFYNDQELAKIIILLINLHQEMVRDGYVDNQSCKEILSTINTLQYYYQFLKPNGCKIRYYRG